MVKTGVKKITYIDINHNVVPFGSEKWDEYILSRQQSEESWIEELEKRRSVLIGAGAKM